MEADPPLAGIRIVDHVAGPLAPLTRYLADLGATVDRVVETDIQGELDRYDDIAANIGKRRHGKIGKDALASLLSMADVIVTDDQNFDFTHWHSQRPALVSMRVADFGSNNVYSKWSATDAVLHALTGQLSRSGTKGEPPLIPPQGIGYQCAATQAAFALLTSLYNSLRTGCGDALEFAAVEGALQALDPGYGIGGSATLGRPASKLTRGRPPRGYLYPILPCSDGHVRICILSARQWQGMFRWLGEPSAFADPRFNFTEERFRSKELIPAISAFFAKKSRAELEKEGADFGVPLAALATMSETVEASHFHARGSFRSVDANDRLPLAASPFSIDGARAKAPAKETSSKPFPPAAVAPSSRAFEGLRVLDLGIIIVGAETSRFFADQGADVVKVEARAFPDGNRASYLPYDMSLSFAAGHRNKRSLGLDLKHVSGRALFYEMVAKADVVLSNFKPGTMESLGLDAATLHLVNPALVIVESSAFGTSGPWSRRMGYGPLVRAAAGLSDLWRYPESEDGFGDAVTTYPDHTAARIGGIAAIALLIRRLRTAAGGRAEIAQVEVMLSHFSADIARSAATPGRRSTPDIPWGVFPASGDDDWCVVTVRGDEDWRRLAVLLELDSDSRLISRAGRRNHAALIDRSLRQWLGARTAIDAAAELQQAGIPAAQMLRVSDLPGSDLYRDRGFFRVDAHPYLAEQLITERRHVGHSDLLEAPDRPAPLMGEHSIEVLQDWISLEAQEIDILSESGIVQPTDAAMFRLIKETMERPPLESSQ